MCKTCRGRVLATTKKGRLPCWQFRLMLVAIRPIVEVLITLEKCLSWVAKWWTSEEVQLWFYHIFLCGTERTTWHPFCTLALFTKYQRLIRLLGSLVGKGACQTVTHYQVMRQYLGRQLNMHSRPQRPLQIQHLTTSKNRADSICVTLELATAGFECK